MNVIPAPVFFGPVMKSPMFGRTGQIPDQNPSVGFSDSTIV